MAKKEKKNKKEKGKDEKSIQSKVIIDGDKPGGGVPPKG
jgi:hypothetical protein